MVPRGPSSCVTRVYRRSRSILEHRKGRDVFHFYIRRSVRPVKPVFCITATSFCRVVLQADPLAGGFAVLSQELLLFLIVDAEQVGSSGNAVLERCRPALLQGKVHVVEELQETRRRKSTGDTATPPLPPLMNRGFGCFFCGGNFHLVYSSCNFVLLISYLKVTCLS